MCSKTVYKWCLVAFNIIFVILGAVTLGLGLFVKYDEDGFTSILSRLPDEAQQVNDTVDIAGLLESAALILIFAGAFMFLVGFLGCCGAWKELRLFLVIYAVILGLIFIMQVAAAIIAVVFRDKVEGDLIVFLRDSLHTGYKDGVRYENNNLVLDDDVVTMAWDLVQFSLECCAVTSYTGYENATAWNRRYTYDGNEVTAVVPVSCCKVSNPEAFPDDLENVAFVDIQACLTNPTDENTNTQGCYYSLLEVIDAYSVICIVIAIGIALIELLGLLFAYWLCQAIKKDEYTSV